ncbi:MAG: hypothetical protein ACTSWK_17680 [Promethearchaeota archaeon]
MNYYRIFVEAYKKEIYMKSIFYVKGHNIASAYSHAINYIKNNFTHKVEIVKIEKEK